MAPSTADSARRRSGNGEYLGNGYNREMNSAFSIPLQDSAASFTMSTSNEILISPVPATRITPPVHHVFRYATPAPVHDCPVVWFALNAPTTCTAMLPPAASRSCRSVARISRASGSSLTRCSSYRLCPFLSSPFSSRSVPVPDSARSGCSNVSPVARVPTRTDAALSIEGDASKSAFSS